MWLKVSEFLARFSLILAGSVAFAQWQGSTAAGVCFFVALSILEADRDRS